MAKPLPQPFDKQKVVAENRRARFDYFVEERLEAGIQLTGTEVKSLRQGEGSIAESYANAESTARLDGSEASTSGRRSSPENPGRTLVSAYLVGPGDASVNSAAWSG